MSAFKYKRLMSSLGLEPLSEKLAEKLSAEKSASREEIAGSLEKLGKGDSSVKAEADAVAAELKAGK